MGRAFIIGLAAGLASLTGVAAAQEVAVDASRLNRLAAEMSAGEWRGHNRADLQARLIDTNRLINCQGIDDVAIAGSRDALKQVILILLDNAIKYTPANEQVVVSTSTTPLWVHITVRDSGDGIDAGLLPHIFERFYRGDLARRGTGVGLGLAIAKALVEAQRGRIEVSTEAGVGTTFTVILPRATVLARSHGNAERMLPDRT